MRQDLILTEARFMLALLLVALSISAQAALKEEALLPVNWQ
jgi:hypothetical protein